MTRNEDGGDGLFDGSKIKASSDTQDESCCNYKNAQDNSLAL